MNQYDKRQRYKRLRLTRSTAAKLLSEKHRRERINASIREMKKLILQDGDQVSRTYLKKADILQLTVRQVEKLRSAEIQNQQFVAGFYDCFEYVQNFCRDSDCSQLESAQLMLILNQVVANFETKQEHSTALFEVNNMNATTLKFGNRSISISNDVLNLSERIDENYQNVEMNEENHWRPWV